MPNRALGYHFLKPRKSLQRGIFLCSAHGCFAFAAPQPKTKKGKNRANHGSARVSKSESFALVDGILTAGSFINAML